MLADFPHLSHTYTHMQRNRLLHINEMVSKKNVFHLKHFINGTNLKIISKFFKGLEHFGGSFGFKFKLKVGNISNKFRHKVIFLITH